MPSHVFLAEAPPTKFSLRVVKNAKKQFTAANKCLLSDVRAVDRAVALRTIPANVAAPLRSRATVLTPLLVANGQGALRRVTS